jgi:hypothetical protein
MLARNPRRAFHHFRMSPVVDQESTFADTEKSGRAHVCGWRQLVFINFLRFRFTEFQTSLPPTGDIILATFPKTRPAAAIARKSSRLLN